MKRIPRKLTLANCRVFETFPGHFHVQPNFTETFWTRGALGYAVNEHSPVNRSGYQSDVRRYSKVDKDTMTCRRIDAVIAEHLGGQS